MADDPLARYLSKLVPTTYDKNLVSGRKTAMATAIAESHLKFTYMFESGSWSHGTAVTGHSDVDYMAWATGTRPALPSSALVTLKSALNGSHWSINALAVSSPTVKVECYSKPNFEIVPAWLSRTVNKDNVFYIPGPGDQWVESVPAAHLRYVSAANDRLSKKVKPLARLLKAWKYNSGAPVSSFYLEMRTAEYANAQNSIYYHLDLRFLMGRIVASEMRAMNDPVKIVSRINATSSDEKRKTALRMMREALGHLNSAYEAKEKQDASTYWTNMYRVFGSDFPYPFW